MQKDLLNLTITSVVTTENGFPHLRTFGPSLINPLDLFKFVNSKMRAQGYVAAVDWVIVEGILLIFVVRS